MNSKRQFQKIFVLLLGFITIPFHAYAIGTPVAITLGPLSSFPLISVDVSAPADADEDGIEDENDNCVTVNSTNQTDTDGDGVGDVCDDDADGDGFTDATEDNCPSVYNPDQANWDDDGTGDACDSTDTDGDILLDSLEDGAGCDPNNSDTDYDGIDDNDELYWNLDCANDDSDGDGLVDGDEGTEDADSDGIINALDTDSDDDGISDDTEMSYGVDDADYDEIPNYLDTDSDNDGILDADESAADADGNGIVDFLEVISASLNGTNDADDDSPAYYPGTAGNGCSLGSSSFRTENILGLCLMAFFFFVSFTIIRRKILSTLFVLLLTISSCGGSGNEEIPDPPAPPTDVSLYVYPHPDGWSEPLSHGTTTLARITEGEDDYLGEGCVGCHGEEFEGSAGPSCYDCHEAFPHNENWTNTSSSDFHGLQAVSQGIEKTCGTQCHGTDFSGGLSNTSCLSCHPLVPHLYSNNSIKKYFSSSTDEWASYDVHGAYVQENNAIDEGLCATNCHGTDYTGGLTNIACSDCHASYPHTLQSSNWTNDHQSYVNSLSDFTCQTANGCHTDKNPGPSTVVQSCTDFCHGGNE